MTSSSRGEIMSRGKFWRKVNIPVVIQRFISNKNRLKVRTFGVSNSFVVPLIAQISGYEIDVDLFCGDVRENVAGKFNHVREQFYGDFNVFYTDGSVNALGQAGFGVYSSECNVSACGRLPDNTSIFTAETYAYLTALQYAHTNNLGRTLICSDSRSLLMNLKKPHFSSGSRQVVNQIKDLLWIMQREGKTVRSLWIPSHSDILGNDRADALAKEGVGRVVNDVGLEPVEFSKIFSSEMLSAWQAEWDNFLSRTNHVFGSYNVKLDLNPWYKQYRGLSRNFVVCISRMRSKHVLTQAHKYKIGVADSPLCDCGMVGDLNHVFFGCPVNSVESSRLIHKLLELKHQLPISIYTLLEIPPVSTVEVLYNFLKSLKIEL